LRGRIEAGSAFDGESPGLAALAAALVALPDDGDGALPPLTFSFESDPQSAANTRFLEFTATCLPEEVSALLGSLGRRLNRAGRPGADSLALARAAALEHARSGAVSLSGALRARAVTELYPPRSPLANPPWATEAALSRLRPEEVTASLRGRFARLELSLAGAIEKDQILRVLETILPRLSPGAAPPVPALAPARAPGSWTTIVLERPDKSQNELLVAWPGDRSKPWDDSATRLLLYLLGETHYAGRLGHALVGPGLVYSVDATLEEAPGLPGFLMIRTAAAPKDTREVIRRIRTIVEEAATGRFTTTELEEAKAYLRGKALRAHDGALATATAALDDLWPARGPAPDEITLDQLVDTARRLFARGAPLCLVGGPGE
jgi:predicted Zn-dependent peptidase